MDEHKKSCAMLVEACHEVVEECVDLMPDKTPETGTQTFHSRTTQWSTQKSHITYLCSTFFFRATTPPDKSQVATPYKPTFLSSEAKPPELAGHSQTVMLPFNSDTASYVALDRAFVLVFPGIDL